MVSLAWSALSLSLLSFAFWKCVVAMPRDAMMVAHGDNRTIRSNSERSRWEFPPSPEAAYHIRTKNVLDFAFNWRHRLGIIEGYHAIKMLVGDAPTVALKEIHIPLEQFWTYQLLQTNDHVAAHHSLKMRRVKVFHLFLFRGEVVDQPNVVSRDP